MTKTIFRIAGIFFVLVLPLRGYGQQPAIAFTSIASTASFRGMSVVDDHVAWISGSHGTVCKTVDGGKTFECMTVPGMDSSDFRSVYAFDADNAILCNIGSPAKIMRTKDGGATWSLVFETEHVAAFIDGIDFWNASEGIVMGDPIDGYLLLLTTNDGGYTWNEVAEENRPQLVEGEACFAASGTAIRCYGESKVIVASGGTTARLFTSDDKGMTWRWSSTPVIQGKESMGIFSFSFPDGERGVVVGGDYKNDSLKTDHIYLTTDGGNNWQKPSRPTGGLRECVEFLSDKMVVATGPSGMDVSTNGGLSWQPLSDAAKFHVIRKARNGTLTLVAGPSDRVGVLKF